MCIPTPRGCNLARREILRVITTSPLPMEKKDVAIFLVYLFYIFWPVYFTVTSCCVARWLFYTSLVWDVVCICECFLQWSDVVIKMNLFMAGCFCCSYLDSVSSFWWSIWELKDVWSGFSTSTCDCCWFPFPSLVIQYTYILPRDKWWYIMSSSIMIHFLHILSVFQILTDTISVRKS